MEHQVKGTEQVFRESETDSEAEVRVRMNEYAKAVREGRIEEIMAFYSDKVVAFDMMPPLQFTSKSQYKSESWQKYFTNVFEFPVQFEFHEVRVESRGDIAFSHSLVEMSGQFKTEGRRIENWLRNTTCWKKLESKWLIVHEHNSVPFDETMKGLTNLKPEKDLH